MAEKLTVKKVKELAMQNYNKGGDAIVECYDNSQIEELINSGINTENKLLQWFKNSYAIDEEYRKAADWYAYGTTDEEEIKKMIMSESETEDNYNEEYDPCYGCQAFDGSYNCKHCPHGDDGRYESPFDVYSPSELGLNVKW